MIRAALVFALGLVLVGCGVLRAVGAVPPTLGDYAAQWAAEVCAEAPADRGGLIEAVNAAAAPAALSVQCGAR